ncbi:LLM class flavin-dependent oxidoreductase [Mycolicibacterium mengxianglii]|uniref:LLM class flavin-dependent oxidoreductase n=1 Tax=Mycolicibacterium mengxianglii TaxID=2736649 RepID=UPI001E514175|nr:LLM class flavin-dependent oxidoreductase [Mycolicibacterium mengxianglii]
MAASQDQLHLAVALDGAGWHPAAWRDPQARPAELLTARYWSDLVVEAERGLLDFVTVEDGLALQSDDAAGGDRRTDRVRGRLDAVLIAARVAPLTRHIGLIPTIVATHTEPFHLSKAIATLDYVSAGRAGVRVQVAPSPVAAAHFGRRRLPESSDELLTEAGDYIEVLRRLWDSWEDDAEIRDVTTGRFIDRTKLHYIDFEGEWFSVKGPSITPRPPQGQPIVAALAHAEPAHRLSARSADVAFVTPRSVVEVGEIAGVLASLRPGAADPVRIFADLVVFLADTAEAAADRRARLDDLAGTAYASDAQIFVGTPVELADLLQEWHAAGATGFRLRPATVPHDLLQITTGLVPELQRRRLFRDGYTDDTLRGRLGLPRPANRYSTAS